MGKPKVTPPEQQPFPIAVVRGEQHHRLVARRRLGDDLGVLEHDPAAELGGIGPRTPDHLEEQVGEAAAGGAANRLPFRAAVLGKGQCQVVVDRFAPPAQQVEGDEGQDRAEGVEKRQRQLPAGAAGSASGQG
jgi:hypothetical protein